MSSCPLQICHSVGTQKVHVGWHPISRKYSDFIELRREESAITIWECQVRLLLNLPSP